MDDYEKYEEDCERIRESNEKLLDEYAKWLFKANLTEKTVYNHVGNIDFYINTFLLYEDAVEAFEGVHSVDFFLGYWFIRKAMWASKSSIRSNAASLKKFYAFMLERGHITEDDYFILKETIKENMDEWLKALKRFDDLSTQDVWRI